MQKTAIFGATGKTGRVITQKIIEKDGPDAVVLVVRDKRKAQELFGTEIEFKTFKYEDSVTWHGLFKEIDFAYLIAPYKGENADFQFMQLLQLAKESGVKKVIFLSGRTTGDIKDSHLNRIEHLVAQSGIRYNILRAGWFMQNFMNWYLEMIRDENAIFLPAADGQTAFIDLKDIADVVYRLFHSRKWDNSLVSITSEESLSHHDVAEIFSEILERDITYMPLPGDEFIHAMSNRNWNRTFSEKLVYLYRFVRKGKEKKISQDYRMIMGKTPGTFKDFVKRYKHVW